MKYVYIYFYLKEENKKKKKKHCHYCFQQNVYLQQGTTFFMFIAKNYSIEYSIVINDYYYDYWANINYTALK